MKSVLFKIKKLENPKMIQLKLLNVECRHAQYTMKAKTYYLPYSTNYTPFC